MASKVSAHRQALITPLAALVLAASLGVGVSAIGRGATPAWHAVAAASLPLLLVTTVVMIVAAVTVALSASLAPAPTLAQAEEPLLLPPRLPMIRRDGPYIVAERLGLGEDQIADLESGDTPAGSQLRLILMGYFGYPFEDLFEVLEVNPDA